MNKNFRLGLIDAGFDLNHEDLGFAEKFENYNEKGIEQDAVNHGTHVAGTMAAKSDNSKGICGVYPYGNGNLYGISSTGIYSYEENGTPFTSSMYIKIALSELLLRDVKVINSSLNNGRDRVNQICFKQAGWESALLELNQNAEILGDFLKRMLNYGYDFVIVSAAGNSSSQNTGNLEATYNSFLNAIPNNEIYKSVYNRIIVVGSIGTNCNVSCFSNAGERTDVYAPGEEIFSTVTDDDYENYNWSGTSTASPHVAGVAAMLWAANGNLTGEMVKTIVCGLPNARSSELNIVDAERCVSYVLNKEIPNSNITEDSNYGSIMSYVIHDDSEKRIAKAEVTAENIDTGEKTVVFTDTNGHYELILPNGEYWVTVEASGYYTYKYSLPLSCTANGVNYADWAELTRDPATENQQRSINEEWIETARIKVTQHYKRTSGLSGNFVCFSHEDVIENEYVKFILRYSRPQEELKEILEDGVFPSANVYQSLIVIEISTGKVTDECGNVWYLNEELVVAQEPIDIEYEINNLSDYIKIAAREDLCFSSVMPSEREKWDVLDMMVYQKGMSHVDNQTLQEWCYFFFGDSSIPDLDKANYPSEYIYQSGNGYGFNFGDPQGIDIEIEGYKRNQNNTWSIICNCYSYLGINTNNETEYGIFKKVEVTLKENEDVNFPYRLRIDSVTRIDVYSYAGKCGENVEYCINKDGVATIFGEGEMDYFDYTTVSQIRSTSPFSQDTVNNQNFSLSKVIIEDGITSIGQGTFPAICQCRIYYIPKSVTFIDKEAFCYRHEEHLIYCYSDSYAYTYAYDNGFKIGLLD